MSISKSFLTFGFLPSPDSGSETRKSISLSASSSSPFSSCSSCLAVLRNHYQTRDLGNNMRSRNYNTSSRRFLVRGVVQPGSPPPLPSGPPSDLIKWIVGIAITVVLPFFTGKWTSFLRIKNQVDTAVQVAENIAEAVEKVAERIEKAAEDIAEDLPEDGGMRKVVDFVEHVAERANKDAHVVDDFIDKVQEVEEKVEDYVESIVEGAVNHEHQEEDKLQESEAQKEEEDDDDEEEEEEEEDDVVNHKHKD